jgi:5-oxoprolinase (ATP-hydrolysing)
LFPLITGRLCFFRKGGPLAVTDANLLLGRLIPDYFPKIFGKSEKESLDAQASRTAFEKLAKEINDSHEKKIPLDEIVYGYAASSLLCQISNNHFRYRFIKVSNETMCRPIRALTEARGYATSKHMLALHSFVDPATFHIEPFF